MDQARAEEDGGQKHVNQGERVRHIERNERDCTASERPGRERLAGPKRPERGRDGGDELGKNGRGPATRAERKIGVRRVFQGRYGTQEDGQAEERRQ